MDFEDFEKLDAYDEGKLNDIDAVKLTECYQNAIKYVKETIIYNELYLKRTDVNWGNDYEDEVNPECIRSEIMLLEERLYVCSLDGSLGQKIKQDERFKEIEIKTFQEYRNEIDEYIICFEQNKSK
ncbi:hypothetical protein M9Y10_037037 [Tritrichomonas musculus]|uniref:Uncharacterized protein n=1 Tax=Tritrichomonas musculus TaxID=1915356 RepID=A0ABR2GTN0_9EUKA